MEIDYAQIPEHTLYGIHQYIEHHIPPGHFLEAVFSNDLREAFGRADEENIAAMFHIVAYLYNKVPGNCWGSPEKVRQWLKQKGDSL